MSHQPIIQVSNLVKRYKNFLALDHFNLTVKKGDILGLLGPNGSGKSTAINCMLSLLTYNQGSIELFGEAMSPEKNHIKQKIGVVPQDVAVFDELTVVGNIDYFCGLYVPDKIKRRQHVEDAIEIVQLEEFRKFYPKQLSGGLKRRLNIACGIAHKPELIFFDEPTVAVDPQSRHNILQSIEALNTQGSTIVYTSHYMEEIEQLCNNIVIIDKGMVIAEGTNDELKKMIHTNEKLIIELPELPETVLACIKDIPGVLDLTYENGQLHIDTLKEEKVLISLLHYLEKEKILFGDFYSLQPTLNDVFLELTGKELRD